MHWPLLNMYSEILDLGQQVFIIRGTFVNRKKGLNTCIYIYIHILIDSYTYTHQIYTDLCTEVLWFCVGIDEFMGALLQDRSDTS